MRADRTWRVCTVAAATLAVALAAAPVAGAKIVATPTPAPFYVPKNPKAACRSHYVKRTVLISRRRGHKTVKVKQVRCLLTRSGVSLSKPVTFPTNLPVAAVTLSIIPSAADHVYATAAGQALTVGGTGVLTNASGTGLSARLVSGPAHGTLTLNQDGTLRYLPGAGSSGIDHFVYKVTGSNGVSSTPATVTIKVLPVAIGGIYTVASGGTLTIPAGGLLAGDVGSGLKASLVAAPANGSLTLQPDGSATYTPADNFSGSDAFSYEAVDAAAQHSNTAVVTIQVGALPPTVVPRDLLRRGRQHDAPGRRDRGKRPRGLRALPQRAGGGRQPERRQPVDDAGPDHHRQWGHRHDGLERHVHLRASGRLHGAERQLQLHRQRDRGR